MNNTVGEDTDVTQCQAARQLDRPLADYDFMSRLLTERRTATMEITRLTRQAVSALGEVCRNNAAS